MKAIVIFDIDGVIRDVGGSYRRALADTVEYFTNNEFRPTMMDIDELKSEGIWNNDWEATQELIYRHIEKQGKQRSEINLNYQEIIDFFQNCYLGSDSLNWNGYITDEPLLVNQEYFKQLNTNNIGWGFFSGAPQAEAEYVLKKRLNLVNPILIAMKDAPSKPEPTGLFLTVDLIKKAQNINDSVPIYYLGDTVADMKTIINARSIQPSQEWIGIGILPPHIHQDLLIKEAYTKKLKEAGASLVFKNVMEIDFLSLIT